jgi:nucleotide-binding universal stress UspA family protein
MTRPPFHIRTILFPTDFSKSSQAAAPHVAGLARAVRAQVYLLNVVPWLPDWHGASESYFSVGDAALKELESGRDASEARCLRGLEEVKQSYFADLACDLRVKTGGVVDSIVELSQEIQADLIMMPTHGNGSLRPFLIGSAAAKVMHDVRCPVWTSPHPRELSPFRLYREIMCAVDYRASASELIARAAEVAGLFHSRLSVVTAIPQPAIHRTSPDSESVPLLKSEILASLRHSLKDLQIDAPLHVLVGSTGEVIRQAASMEDADLVVIGRGHLNEQMGQLRTHAYEIIWNSPCPVLSL